MGGKLQRAYKQQRRLQITRIAVTNLNRWLYGQDNTRYVLITTQNK